MTFETGCNYDILGLKFPSKLRVSGVINLLTYTIAKKTKPFLMQVFRNKNQKVRKFMFIKSFLLNRQQDDVVYTPNNEVFSADLMRVVFSLFYELWKNFKMAR